MFFNYKDKSVYAAQAVTVPQEAYYPDPLCWQNAEFYSVKPTGAYTSYPLDLMG
jgi:hypothetical protein